MIFFRSLKKKGNDFSLVENGSASSLFFDKQDYWGVKRAVGDLADDIERISGIKPVIDSEVEVEDRGDDPSEQKLYKYSVPKDNKKEVNAVFIGTIGKSKIIDKLIDEKRIDVLDIAGKWESSVIQVIDNPVPGVNNGLVIAGSDKRGTIFAIYELSQLIGVSPWYWWADVPVKHRDTIYVKEGTYKYGEPSVKYRGIFLNDEAPSLTTWVEKRYGTFNHNFYEKVFELLLRLKANYLWPAMWKPRVFNEEDPLNPKYADKYGIVMGTSHHEPMMRSWEEWGKVGEGPWNYKTNRDNIYRFWQEGLSRVKDYEGIVTVGMRGDGDEAMEENGSIEESKRLLEKVVEDQREIISTTFNEDASAIPQLIALYKEVQGFYEKGLNIPDDITLLLADDNFANIRMLPTEDQRDRHGGYGMYYHFDYVGGPRSYQWINTVPLQKIWEQMRMTYDYGVDRIWIVNVGDLKPMELPIDFFLEMAWDIDRWNYDNIKDYALYWIEKQFGQEYSEEIADILLKYTKYNGRRKPELLVEDTYSLINYREAERVLADFDNITGKAECIYSELPEEKKPAFFQLVLYPARASRNIMKMHVYAAKNRFYAEQGRTIANDFADLTEKVYENEAADSNYYNKELSDGKWEGMMLQPHIGKSNWRGPAENTMPEVEKIVVETGSEMGVYPEGSEKAFSAEDRVKTLPTFSKFNKKKYYLEVYNKKADPFEYEITNNYSWIELSEFSGVVRKQERIWVSINWEQAPIGEDIKAGIKISGTGEHYKLEINVFNPANPEIKELEPYTFVESNGYISIEAEHYVSKEGVNGVGWEKIDDYGRTLSSMFIVPSTADSFEKPEEAPYLEYRFYAFTTGDLEAVIYTAPGLNVDRRRGLKYAISIDRKELQMVDTFPPEYDGTHSCPYWAESVMNNAHITSSTQHIEEPGYHTLRIMMVDPGVVIQKIVLDMGGVKPSYLGPPESFYKKS